MSLPPDMIREHEFLFDCDSSNVSVSSLLYRHLQNAHVEIMDFRRASYDLQWSIDMIAGRGANCSIGSLLIEVSWTVQ